MPVKAIKAHLINFFNSVTNYMLEKYGFVFEIQRKRFFSDLSDFHAAKVT